MANKKGIMTNLKSGFGDKKQRFVLIGTISVMIVALLMFTGGGEDAQLPQGKVGASVGLAPDKNAIDKTKVGDEIDVPKDSLLIKQLEEGREKKVDEIKSKNDSTSHIDQLRLKNEAMVTAQQKADSEKTAVKPIKTGISDIIEQRKREQIREKERNYRNNGSTGQQSSEVTVTRNMILDAFLQKELADAEEQENSFDKYYSKIEASQQLIAATEISEPNSSTNEENNKTGQSDSYSSDYKGEVAATISTSSDESEVVNGDKFDVLPGDINLAIILTSINSDMPGPVMAQIMDGSKLDGAKFIGGIERKDEKLQLSFNTMTFEGRVYGVSVIAVELSNDSTTMADGVDRHILERYGSLALASFVEGYANALSSSTSVVGSDGSNTTSTEALPNASSQVKVALGNVGSTFIPVLQNKFDRPPTVTLNSGRAVALQFLEPLNI